MKSFCSLLLKRGAAYIAYIGKVSSSVWSRRLGEYNLSLMYHRIVPVGQENILEPGMYVTPSTFEVHLRILTENALVAPLKVTFQSEVEWHHAENDQPLCALTFDDGWRDFYQYVFPLLKKYSTPAIVFLPTSFIGTKKVFWTDRVMELFHVLKGQRGDFKGESKLSSTVVESVYGLLCSGPNGCYGAIDYLKLFKYDVIDTALDELEAYLGIESCDKERTFLTWEEVLEMKESGLVEFGSHTHNHAILTTLNREEIRFELEKSKEILIDQEVVDPDFIPFCYPNGNYNDEIAKMVQEAGYSLAVTTQKGWNPMGADLFTLNRVGLHNDISNTPSLFLARVAGLL